MAKKKKKINKPNNSSKKENIQPKIQDAKNELNNAQSNFKNGLKNNKNEVKQENISKVKLSENKHKDNSQVKSSENKHKNNSQVKPSGNKQKNNSQIKQSEKKSQNNSKEHQHKEHAKNNLEKKSTENSNKQKSEKSSETREEKVIFSKNEKDNKNRNRNKNITKKINNNTNQKKNGNKNINEKNNEEKIKKSEIIEVKKSENDKDNGKRKFGAILIILIVFLVVVLFFSTTFAMIHSMSNTIAKGVMINNIDVSGLTKDEAKSKLNEAFKTILDVNMNLNYKDYNYIIKPEDVELSYNFQKELDEAYSVGRKGNIVECNYTLIATAFLNKNIKFDYKYNTDNLNSIVEEVSTSIPGLVKQYSHYMEGNNLIINPGTDGIIVEKDKLKSAIENNLKNRNPLEIIKKFDREKINISVKEVKADSIDMDKVYSEVHKEPENAYYTPATEKEKAKIYPDVDGIDFAISIDEAKAKLNEEANEYVIPLNRKKADVTINDIGLEAFPNKLQTFSTRYDASNWERSENLRIATSKIDGTVLMPGQQFSFNGVVGERTVQAGYKNAAIYEGDAVVDGLAGGICQVSSTLYDAVLLANLQIDERYNHSFKTSYLDAGKDATVVYGIKDFKFTNTRSYPIKIEGSAENGVVSFSIYGIEEEVEYKINIIPVITSTIPYNVKTVTDNSLAPGQQIVKQAGMSGCRVTTYKEKVLNGAVVSKEVISNDLYKAMDRIVNVGPALAPLAPTPELPIE